VTTRRLEPWLAKSSRRGGVVVDAVVLHWTAGRGEPDDLARYFASTTRQASYHLAVGRNGDVLQLVPLDRAAWHAGDGRLDGVRPNPRSVGVALCNRGPWPQAPDELAFIGPHPKPGVRSTRWEAYPRAQVEALVDVLRWLVTQLPTLRLITGHEDVARGKIDPGPALPWDALPLDALGLTRWRGPWPSRELLADAAKPLPRETPTPPGVQGGPAADPAHARK